LAGTNLALPPKEEEIEVSVFGPGYGESVLIHLGQQAWMIVDSCLDLASKQPAPLAYLRTIGVDPAEAVQLIIATHWHDDHVRGLSKIFDECEAASFVCSDALRSDEFLTLVEAQGTRSMMESSGVQEFAEILQVLERRQRGSRSRAVSPKWALADRLLWRSPLTIDGRTMQRTVHSLSPSDVSVRLAYDELMRLLPPPQTTKRRLVTQAPNHTAVALWVNVGRISLLLGADLEETRHPGTGWSVVASSTTRSSGKASVFKVPHHGSHTADQPDVWTAMLEQNPLAVVTPFVRGKVSLPTNADARRLCDRTTQAYVTATTERRRAKNRSRAVERTVRETVRSIREVHSSHGHVRARIPIRHSENDPWRVELFGDALPLSQLYVQKGRC
jgi:beta-lactamase superfamily II metal-dependent hydrolase